MLVQALQNSQLLSQRLWEGHMRASQWILIIRVVGVMFYKTTMSTELENATSLLLVRCSVKLLWASAHIFWQYGSPHNLVICVFLFKDTSVFWWFINIETHAWTKLT